MVGPNVIRNVELFKYLTPEECDRVIKETEERRFRRGEVIFTANMPGNEMFIVKSGRVKAYKVFDNNEIVFAEFGPGDVFGEMSLIDEYPRSASVAATEDCVTYALNRGTFRAIIDNEPTLGVKLLFALAELFSKRMRKTDKQLETYHLVNKALTTNEEFRQLYMAIHS